jgi:hypothetical protein
MVKLAREAKFDCVSLPVPYNVVKLNAYFDVCQLSFQIERHVEFSIILQNEVKFTVFYEKCFWDKTLTAANHLVLLIQNWI